MICGTLAPPYSSSEGVHPKIVQELLGHANISITLDTYSHVLPGMREQTAAAIESTLSPAGSALTGP